MQVFVYEVVRFTTVTNMITNLSSSTDYWLFLMGLTFATTNSMELLCLTVIKVVSASIDRSVVCDM